MNVMPIREARLQEDGTHLYVQGVIENMLRCGQVGPAKGTGRMWEQAAFMLEDSTGKILVEVNEPAFTPQNGQHLQVKGKANVYPGVNSHSGVKEWKITLKATPKNVVLVTPEGESALGPPPGTDSPNAPRSYGSVSRVAGQPVGINIPDGPQQRVKPLARQRGEYERIKASQALLFQQALVGVWHDWCEGRDLLFHDEALAALVNTVMIQYLRGNLVDDLTGSSQIEPPAERATPLAPIPKSLATPPAASQDQPEGSQEEPPWVEDALGPVNERESK